MKRTYKVTDSGNIERTLVIRGKCLCFGKYRITDADDGSIYADGFKTLRDAVNWIKSNFDDNDIGIND